jgi:RNA polymerase sigma-70 factor (ECF subfamily)
MMTMLPPDNHNELLARARAGHDDCLGQLLEHYRNYLVLVARTQISLHLTARVSPSDLVQESFMQACSSFRQFRGTSEAEFLAWLRRILVRNILAAFACHRRAQKRDTGREVSLQQLQTALDRSSQQIQAKLAAAGSSPSVIAQRHELAVIVADRLAELPDHYREVIVLRNLESRSFDEIALRMGRTVSAVRKMWSRAIDRLRFQFK